jgi:hypothetical protein
MVNLPPDPSDRRPVGGGGGSDPRIRDLDELLAVVLAFMGIGSVLWWGLARGQGTVAGLIPLERRAGADTSRVAPAPQDPTPGFEPRTFERGDRPVDDPTGLLNPAPAPPRPILTTPGAVVPAVPAPVPSSPTAAQGSATEPVDISDVPTTHWAYPFIKPMFDQGYLPDLPESGFRPDQPLTRAEFAALLSQAFGGAPREGSVRTFSDVPTTYWAASAIDDAVIQGFMNGYAEGDFRPDRAVPRYEVLVALATGLGLPPALDPEQTLEAFVDASPMPDWAKPKVAAAVETDLVVNYPARDQLKPAQAATRAEIVAMVHQALVQLGQLPAVESEYAVP